MHISTSGGVLEAGRTWLKRRFLMLSFEFPSELDLGQKTKESAKMRALRATMRAPAAVRPMEAPSIQGRLMWNTLRDN